MALFEIEDKEKISRVFKKNFLLAIFHINVI